MKIKEVIKRLQECLDNYGDVDVLSNDIDYSSVPVDNIELRTNSDGVVDGIHLGD